MSGTRSPSVSFLQQGTISPSLTDLRYGDSEEKMKMCTFDFPPTILTHSQAPSAKIPALPSLSLKKRRMRVHFSLRLSPIESIMLTTPTDMTLMTAYGASAGITYKFGGTVANTIQAHRIIQHFQETSGPEVADKILMSLYRQYFEEEKHPSSPSTLLQACADAGIPDAEAKKVVEDQDEGLMETKMEIRQQAGNGVDSVPIVVLEGRRRDITIQGANEVGDYAKGLRQIVKESS